MTITQQTSYRCSCGALLEWDGPAQAGAFHNGTRAYSRRAVCPACGARYVVRVWECTFRPRGILSERWFRIEDDGAEVAATIERVTQPSMPRAQKR